MRRSAGKVRPLSNAFAGDELLPALVPEKEKPHQVSDMVLAAIYAALPKVNTVETIEAAAVKAGLKDTSSIARHLKVVAWSGGAITFRQFATVLRLGSHQAKLSDKEVLEYLETFEALGGGVAGGGKVQANDIEMCAQGFGLSIGSSVAAGSALDFISFCDVVHASEDFSNGPSCQPQSSTSRESFPATPPKPTSAVGDVAPPSTTTSDRAQTGNRLQIKQAVRRIANLISTLKQDGAESTDHHANSISDSFSLPPDTYGTFWIPGEAGWWDSLVQRRAPSCDPSLVQPIAQETGSDSQSIVVLFLFDPAFSNPPL
ncbi:hypothetical protein DIPPA_12493 [Diplonema papillatum]|nr:hypothetical protein DIPPA_12493 [Diplonema papillatum]